MGAIRDGREALRVLVRDGVPPHMGDATRLLADLREQGLVGLVPRLASVGWPESDVDLLRTAQRTTLYASVQLLDGAARAISLLGASGLRVLPLKGCAVAEWLYDSPGERSMMDADVLALDDWRASRAALEDAGYTRSASADHASAYRDPTTGVVVELHRAPTSCAALFPFEREALWQRSRERSGQIRRVPSSEDVLVQLALHAAFQHGLVLKLGQYLDFRRLIERARPDPTAAWEIARAMRAERALAAALEAARIVVGAPVADLAEQGHTFLTGGLRRFLREAQESPLQLVHPAQPHLARLRWELARGQRFGLLAATLMASSAVGQPSLMGRLIAAPHRAVRIVARMLRSRTNRR
jgi:hypothetical protein